MKAGGSGSDNSVHAGDHWNTGSTETNLALISEDQVSTATSLR